MSKFADTVSSLNSLVMMTVTLGVVGVLGFTGWMAYDRFLAPELRAKQQAEEELKQAKLDLEQVSGKLSDAEKTVGEQAEEIGKQKETISQQSETIEVQGEQIVVLEEENERLETAMRLLKVNHRLAHIKVLKVDTDESTGETYSEVEFLEMTPEGQPLGKPKQFRLNGDEIRIDCWVVKFDDKYIQESDLHRSTSLCVFKSIYGNVDGPTRAKPLEQQYSRPLAYARGSQLTEFEKKIWDDFWDISNDPRRALELGIRANHGQVNYIKAQEGLTYQVDLRASDGITIRPIADDRDSSGNDASDGNLPSG